MKMLRKDKSTSYRLTRTGKLFLVGIALAILPAYLLSVSMMFLMSTLFLGLFVFNLFYVRTSLRGVHLSLSDAPDFYAGKPGVASVAVRNKKRFFRVRFLDVGMEVDLEPVDFQRLDCIMPGKTGLVNVTVTPQKRGWFHISHLVCESSGPYGFSTRTLRQKFGENLLAYPQLLDQLPAALSSSEMDAGCIPQNSGDYQYLGAYRPGDDVRLIHWRKSTLQETPVLIKDLIKTESVEPKIFVPDDCPHFEYAVSAIATYFQASPLAGWSLYTDYGVLPIDNLDEMLKALALIEPLKRAPESDDFEMLGATPLFASQILPE